MKTALWIGGGVVAVVVLVAVGLAAGWALWGQRLWAVEPLAYAPLQDGGNTGDDCTKWGYGRGHRMMGRAAAAPEVCRAWDSESSKAQTLFSPGELTIEEAHAAAKAYLAAQGYPDLEVTEVMEFERNFYAIAREPGTGVGAMELLIDKETSTVSPEIGPNMMWNVRYGMHRSGGVRKANVIAHDEALEIAQRWLDANRPGLAVEEHADPFHGYYTIHTLSDGRITGMLSVHGTTGQVWYHTWHGGFVRMIEHEDYH